MNDNQSMNPTPMKKAEDKEPVDPTINCVGCNKETSMPLCPLCAAERMGLEKLSLQDGDVVLLKTPVPPPQEMVNQLGKAIHALGKKCVLFVMPSQMSLESVNEEAMRKSGWIRAPKSLILPSTAPIIPKKLIL